MIKRKKLLLGIFVLCVGIISICAVCFAQNEKYIAMLVDVPAAIVDGEGVSIDDSGEIAPYIKNGRTMLPVRFVSQSLGAEVGWDEAARLVTITKGTDVLSMTIGENIMYKNGQQVALDAPSEITGGRTMVPVRAVAEGFDKYVHWNDGLIIICDKSEAENIAEFEKKVASDAEAIMNKYNIKPLAVNISIGGQLLRDFNPMNNTYTIRPETDDISKLHVTAMADKFSTCTVEMPEAIPGDIKITVRAKLFEGLSNVYTIKVKEPAPFKVFARTSQDGNPPENTFDEDFSTRWAAEGEQMIVYEFNEPVQLSKVKIAFWKASAKRKASLAIHVRADAEGEWVEVFKGNSTYETEELETFEFEEQTVKYVRITGYGNTENKWNSILEVAFE